jgi:hypothetical protein
MTKILVGSNEVCNSTKGCFLLNKIHLKNWERTFSALSHYLIRSNYLKKYLQEKMNGEVIDLTNGEDDVLLTPVHTRRVYRLGTPYPLDTPARNHAFRLATPNAPKRLKLSFEEVDDQLVENGQVEEVVEEEEEEEEEREEMSLPEEMFASPIPHRDVRGDDDIMNFGALAWRMPIPSLNGMAVYHHVNMDELYANMPQLADMFPYHQPHVNRMGRIPVDLECMHVDDLKCSICFAETNLADRCVTNCHHAYCIPCLERWEDKTIVSLHSFTCPNCRGVIRDVFVNSARSLIHMKTGEM